MTACDALGAHPAAAKEAVLVDRLLRVPRTGRLVATPARQPGEEHPVCPYGSDPDPTAHPSHLGRRTSQYASLEEDSTHRPDECVMVGSDDRRPGDDEDIPARLERWRHRPECHSEATPNPIANHRAAEPSPGGQSEPSRPEVRPSEPCVEERVGPGGPVALQRREVLWTGEHHEPRRVMAAPVRQTVSRFRPRTRRAARTRRPPVVFIRARKPCSFARWRFLGW